jgi:hypothetical protein
LEHERIEVAVTRDFEIIFKSVESKKTARRRSPPIEERIVFGSKASAAGVMIASPPIWKAAQLRMMVPRLPILEGWTRTTWFFFGSSGVSNFVEFGDHHDIVFILALEDLLVVLDERDLVERGQRFEFVIGFVPILLRGNIEAAHLIGDLFVKGPRS